MHVGMYKDTRILTQPQQTQGAVNHNDVEGVRAALEAAKALLPIGIMTMPRLAPSSPTVQPVLREEEEERGWRTDALSPLAVLLEGPFTEYHVSALMLAAYSGHEEVRGNVCVYAYVGLEWAAHVFVDLVGG